MGGIFHKRLEQWALCGSLMMVDYQNECVQLVMRVINEQETLYNLDLHNISHNHFVITRASYINQLAKKHICG
jgi:hypothetical protein